MQSSHGEEQSVVGGDAEDGEQRVMEVHSSSRKLRKYITMTTGPRERLACLEELPVSSNRALGRRCYKALIPLTHTFYNSVFNIPTSFLP